MTVAQVIFYIFAALAVGGGLGVVLMRNAVYAALFLILSLLAVAASTSCSPRSSWRWSRS